MYTSHRAVPLHSALSTCAALLTATLTCAADPPIQYPESERVEHVDAYHGQTVEDPYRWLEDDVRESMAVLEWVTRQNEVTFEYLKRIPQRNAIEKRLTELWNYEKYSAPYKTGGRYFYSKNDGLQNQDVVYMMDTLDAEPVVLFDPNTWSADGTVALSGMSVSEDGRYVAYGIAEAGSDWNTWRIRDLATGNDLDDEVNWVKFSSPAWTIDGKGFFYGRYDEPSDEAFHNVNKFQKLYYHRAGTPQAMDVLVMKNDYEPDWGFGPDVTDDGRYLVITVWKGTADKYRVMVRDLRDPYAMPVDLIDTFEAEYSFIDNDASTFYFKTDLDAPRGRIIAIDITRPQRDHWREIVPQTSDTLRGADVINDQFVLSYLADASTRVRICSLDGTPVRDVDLPGIGSAGGFNGKRDYDETFYSYSSFAQPPGIYRYDMNTGKSTLMHRADVDMNPDDYITTQVFFTSTDGTRVPMFLTHRKDLSRNGALPTLLYGYGGFSIPITPGFSITRLAWLEMGGVYAVANLRGGGEYGEDWHQAGTKLNKQNVFDDFISAAEWLIKNGYTRPDKLAIQGGSNGGLLVGACMAQRPDLFGVCLPAVGVMDMLRFHKFTIGWAWVDDYGSSDDPEQFEALRAYSPYHRLTPGTIYPATLISTADTDDRVVPGHSFKFAAALQYAQAGTKPVLIRIETRAGHGAGKPTAKRIEEAADVMAFMVKELGVESPLPKQYE
jgi:prolyl oligopeptidase